MKMKGAKQVHYDSGPNMTPLVDVVMVILIFLMLCGKFGGNEHYLSNNIPIRMNGTGKNTSPVPDDVDFRITVDSLGSDRFNARVQGVDNPITDKDELRRVLGESLGGLLGTVKSVDNIQVLIDPGRTVKYSFLIQVYEAVLAASYGDKHFTKVAFAQSHG